MDSELMSALALYASLFFTGMAIGGIVLFAFAVAPIVHRVLDKAPARTVIRAIFPRYYIVLEFMVWLAAIGGFLTNVAAGLVLAVIAGGFLFARQIMMPRINALNDEVARGSIAAQGPAKMLHAWSVRMNMIQLFMLVLVFWFLALSVG